MTCILCEPSFSPIIASEQLRMCLERERVVCDCVSNRASPIACGLLAVLQAYYDELMQGKTGRHDLKIKELKERQV